MKPRIPSLAACLAAACARGSPQPPEHAPVESIVYDVVIRNGRVIDPESGFDSVAELGSGGV